MLDVAIGSSADAGSSSRMTSGSTASAAEALLLATGERERAPLEAVFHLIPKRRPGEGPLDALVEALAHAEHAWSPRHVVVNRLRERIRLLEDHADPAADGDGVDAGAVEVLAVVQDLALDAGTGNHVVHPVQAADKGALAAAGGPDERRHVIAVDLESHVFHRRVLAVEHGEVAHVEDDLAPRRGALLRPLDDFDGRHFCDRIQLVLRHLESLRRCLASTAFESTLITSTKDIRTSAVAHARAWSSGFGDSRY